MTSLIKNIKLPPLEKSELEKLEKDLTFFLENKHVNKIRKAVMGDFLNNVDMSCRANTLPPLSYEKPKNYRIQDEFGEKKFIKP